MAGSIYRDTVSKVQRIRIGIDDTDSPDGMCTTYLGALLCERLENLGYTIADRLLIRLNPNAPFKTRGNAAICIVLESRCGERGNDGGHWDGSERESGIADEKKELFKLVCGLIDEYAEFDCEKTNPGVVVCESPISHAFYEKALRHFCTIDEVKALLDGRPDVIYRGWKLGRGLIGATAAVSAELPDFTYELLAYRNPKSKGIREFDRDSIFLAEKETYPQTWDSVDPVNDAVVCVPHTPDPVLFGIRGCSPDAVSKARSCIISENPERQMIWRTNQGTDAHLIDGDISTVEEGCSYRLPCYVLETPATLEGGHVLLKVADMPIAGEDAGRILECMAYEPTKNFRDIVRKLRRGDFVTVCGSYKNGSLNLEKICVKSLAKDTVKKPPICACGKRMTSAGRGQGYKCRKCGAKATEPEITVIPREIAEGWYEVPPVARRHLSMPLVRRANQCANK
jgi:tRNA(Ile2)-agmatinylcytidine synthase